MNQDWYGELANYLRNDGHTDEQVAKILKVVRRYDLSTQHDSVMDSIASGKLSLSSIIKEAIGESE